MGKYKVSEPKNELQTREWFIAHIDEFDYSIIASQRPFPDYTLTDEEGNMIATEMEYLSSNFVQHGHPVDDCGLMICWKHNLNLPLPVLELSTMMMHPPNTGAIKATESDSQHKAALPKQVLRKVAERCSDEMDAFNEAMIADMKAQEIWFDIVREPRMALFAAQTELEQALKEAGGEKALYKLGKLHPHDLFRILHP